MKAKVLKILAELPFEIVAKEMKEYGFIRLEQLVKKLCFAYTAEDVWRIKDDLRYKHNL